MLSPNTKTICSGSEHPTTLYGSKTSPGRKPEVTTSDGNIAKKIDKTSSASINSVNMGSNVINMSRVPVKVGYAFIPMPCLTIAVKAHLSQKIL